MLFALNGLDVSKTTIHDYSSVGVRKIHGSTLRRRAAKRRGTAPLPTLAARADLLRPLRRRQRCFAARAP
jgi:hypothetical protein